MIRTTFQTINRHTQSVIQTRYTDLAKLQQKMSTGKALTRPSDGPVETANSIKLKTQNVQLRQYETNIYDGLAWMEVTDTSLMSMNTVIERVRELAIQGDNDTLSPTERRYINDEIEQLTRQMVSLINTRYKGDYIFSGSQVNNPAVLLKEMKSGQQDKIDYGMAFFDGSGKNVGDTVNLMDPNSRQAGGTSTRIGKIIPGSLEIIVNGEKMVENVDYTVDYMSGEITLADVDGKYYPNIDPNTSLPYPPHPMAQDWSPTAIGYPSGIEIRVDYMDRVKDYYGNPIDTDSDIFRQIEEGTAIAINTTIDSLAVNGRTNIFTSLVKLGQALIRNDLNNHIDINAAIKELDASVDKILAAQSTNGSIINRFETTLERNENQQTEVTRLESQLEDADYAEIITNYMVLQTVFNAALNSTARIMQTSLADYLR